MRCNNARMSKQTAEEREAITLQMAELRARMDELRPRVTSTTIPQWIAICKEWQSLEQQLEDDL